MLILLLTNFNLPLRYDCGLFVCAYATCLADGTDLEAAPFDESDMVAIRARVALTMLQSDYSVNVL